MTVFKELYAQDTQHIRRICTQMNQSIPSAAIEEVHQTILGLKMNKGVDYMDQTSEHLKYGGLCVKTDPLNLVNDIFSTKWVPPVLKSGQITPIFKERREYKSSLK